VDSKERRAQHLIERQDFAGISESMAKRNAACRAWAAV